MMLHHAAAAHHVRTCDAWVICGVSSAETGPHTVLHAHVLWELHWENHAQLFALSVHLQCLLPQPAVAIYLHISYQPNVSYMRTSCISVASIGGLVGVRVQ